MSSAFSSCLFPCEAVLAYAVCESSLFLPMIQYFLNCAAVSMRSTFPRNKALQQYLSRPRLSITFFLSSPFPILSLYSSQRCATGFPQLGHLIGIIILAPHL